MFLNKNKGCEKIHHSKKVGIWAKRMTGPLPFMDLYNCSAKNAGLLRQHFTTANIPSFRSPDISLRIASSIVLFSDI